jgi:hypothetical protein
MGSLEEHAEIMKKLTILTILLGSSAVSVFASGAGACDNVSSSGCGVWWNNYTLGTSTDGIFAQSPGVGLSYTANYTSVSASQNALTATFPWLGLGSSNTTATTSNDTVDYAALLFGSSSSTGSTSTAGSNNSSYNSILNSLTSGSTTVTTNNVASVLPTNTGGTTTMALFSDSAVSSYSSYLAQIYGVTYGSQTNQWGYNPNAIGNADPIPEPSSYITIGFGLAAAVAYARRRKSK